MSPRILHVSDLHFGASGNLEDPALDAALRELIARVEPSLVAVSGDLTHAGRAAQHAAAAGFLRGLGPPVLVAPGNHDIPQFRPTRLTSPWREFERVWETTMQVHATPELQVVGLRSVRPWTYQGGGLSEAQLAFAEARLGEAAPGALRCVVFHHPMPGAPWRSTKLPLSRRNRVLDRLNAAGTELILTGHIHQATIVERGEFLVTDGGPACVLATTSGLGRPRASRRYEACGVLVHTATASELTVEVLTWTGTVWSLRGTRRFARA